MLLIDRRLQKLPLPVRVFLQRLWIELYRDRTVYLLLMVTFGLSTLFFVFLGIPQNLKIDVYSMFFTHQYQWVLGMLLFGCLCRAIFTSPQSPLKAFARSLYVWGSRPEKMVALALFAGAVSIIFSCFTSIKSTIGAQRPFQFDELFIHWDAMVHFGVQPWEITHALFDSPYASFTLNFLYNLWFFLMLVSLFHLYLSNHSCRSQYLLSFLSAWVVLGGIAAMLMSSAGPCYVDELYQNTLFSPLFERLAEQSEILTNTLGLPLWALSTQEQLWQTHVHSQLSMGGGISAMPSMHVSIATVMALGARAIHRGFGWLATAYLVAILIGSVHLGWHYAVDGYVSIIATFGLWKLCGWIVSKSEQNAQ